MNKTQAWKELTQKFESAMSKTDKRIFIHRVGDSWVLGGDLPSMVVCKTDSEFALEVAQRASLGIATIKSTIKAYRETK